MSKQYVSLMGGEMWFETPRHRIASVIERGEAYALGWNDGRYHKSPCRRYVIPAEVLKDYDEGFDDASSSVSNLEESK